MSVRLFTPRQISIFERLYYCRIVFEIHKILETMQEAEHFLSQKTNTSSNPFLIQVLNELDKAVVYSKTGNISTNKKLWENYSKEWLPQELWVKKMAKQVCMEEDLQTVGDEWAPRKDTLEIIQSYIMPFITNESTVAEIGVGGGG